MNRLITLLIVLLLAPVSFAADRPLLTVSETIVIQAPPAKVWNIIKAFDGIPTWIPLIEKCELVEGSNGKVGAIRALTLKGGTVAHEELVAYREQDMTFSYALYPGPVPLDDYVATTSVRPNVAGSGSVIVWVSNFRRKNFLANPPEGESDATLIKLISGVYQEALQKAKQLAETN